MSLVQAQQEPVIKMAVLWTAIFIYRVFCLLAKGYALDKKEIRALVKNLFLQNQEFLAEKSSLVCKKIIASQQFQNALEIYAYMALPDEVDLSNVIKQALQDGKKLALPKIISKDDGIMKFFYLNPEKTLTEQTSNGAYGILEPDESKPALPDPDSKILILVPGRAFTKNGDRLGRGKGYYDRYLSNGLLRCAHNDGDKKRLPNISVAGVCFGFQVLPELPTDPNDISMDILFY